MLHIPSTTFGAVTLGAPTPSSKNCGLATKALPLFLLQYRSLLQLCHHASPTKTPDIVTLLSQASRWNTVWTCRAEGGEEPFVVKLVPEAHSVMIWREFYLNSGNNHDGISDPKGHPNFVDGLRLSETSMAL
ncbi:hypothetical protein EV421DRAFT_1729524 [Armillaria borealis]|uniref:Uncharacterized protein n=1 Tax=Armillaria borealis TaxID=47425 RepID=A0AA39N1B5_9AGAR|nr:hypothetical protein EV421DRAFT_1729524 [Armillaria borealis]